MGIFDWIKSGDGAADEDGGISRRDFFARVAGRPADAAGSAPQPSPEPAAPADPNVLHTFHVARFPYHDGPVLVPSLRVGQVYDLMPDAAEPSDPNAVRIQWGRNKLGYVPQPLSEEIRRLLEEGPDVVCRAARVDPGAELAKVLEVEVVRKCEV